MAARYAYWRSPTGGPYRATDNKHAPARLLAEFGKSAFINEEGRPAWRGMLFVRFEHVVEGAVVILDKDGRELGASDTRGIVCRAMCNIIKSAGGQSPIEPSALLQEADKEAAAFLRKHLEPYALVTSVSAMSLPARRIKVDECTIESLQSRKRYPLPKVAPGEFPRTPPRLPARYVRVRTLGRSIHEAADRALDVLALTCGLWNLFGTYHAGSLWFGGARRRPLGVIRAGPISTLHSMDGSAIENLFWYDSDAAESEQQFTPKEWPAIEKKRRWAFGRLRRLPYRQDLRRLIGRYDVALSRSDPDVAFLQLWSILESITNTVGGNYDETIRRTTWTEADRELAAELLAYLRCYRNQYVHAARSGQRSDQVAQLMKYFVEFHLLCLLRNDLGVQRLEEYGACLSLPASVDVLKRRHELTGRAIRLCQRWRKSE